MDETTALLTENTTVTLTPGYEGANIGTAIGFKHGYYLVEQAVIEHFARSGQPVGRLYERHGLGFDIVEQKMRLSAPIFLDDDVVAQVRPVTRPGSGGLSFKVTLTVESDGAPKTAVTSTVEVLLRADDNDLRVRQRLPIPTGLDRFVVKRIGPAAAGTGVAFGDPGAAGDPVLDLLLAGRNAHGWKVRIPYPYVHFYERLQMSGYVRLMEEAKYRFVAARGISIGTLLAERNWIPVVTQSRLTLLDEALLEEELYVTYTVEDVIKNVLYTARVDYHVVRDTRLVRIATGTITHGYVVVHNDGGGWMVDWDERVARAVRGQGVAS